MKLASKEKIVKLKEDGTWDELVQELDELMFQEWKNGKADHKDYECMQKFMFKVMMVCEDARSTD